MSLGREFDGDVDGVSAACFQDFIQRDLVPVIDNASDAPGTVLADCAEAFLEHFRNAYLTITKGQGNYEPLSQFAAHIGFPTGTLVAERTLAWAASDATAVFIAPAATG